MEVESIPVLLVTANVGSVFEDPSRLLNTWINEFVDKVKHIRPQFLALHLQEVGGKTYEKSMEYVEKFIQMLCENLDEYNRIRIYLDEDYNSAEHFTALGNLYFIHHSLKEVKIWNFLTHEWETGDGKSIHTGNIEAIATKEKSKFPQHFFPECKWSRKGFLRTRWELNCTVIDLINIHLFHDASNLAACEEFPSVYCKTRRRALVHTLEKFHIDTKNGFAPFFVFGDFNFRCDTEGVVKKLTEDLTKHRIQSAKNDSTKLQYKNSEGENVLIVGKKEFTHNEHQTKFKESWLQQFDREIEPLREILVEFPITFPPSYPYEEEPELPKSYMSTRCPAWCDRIVMNPNARDLLVDESFSSSDYNVIGENVCMGDHKPVYLSVRVKSLQGIVRCCECYENYSNNLPARKFYSDHKQYILNKNIILSSKSALNSICCLYNNENFYNILLECRNLDDNYKNKLIKSRIDSLKNLHQTKSSLDNNVNSNLPNIINEIDNQQPLISINITDTDNFNICLCTPSITSLSDQKVDDNIDNTICSVCQNIIKYQSNEHRCTLVTKRLMLSNDIIVNRIDTHYLNTTNLDNYLGQEPYTPESAESHSPYPEFDEVEVNNAILNDLNSTTTSNNYQLNNNATTQIKFSHNNYNQSKDFIHMNSSDKIQSNSSNNLNRDFNVIEQSRGVVSPVQLKTRLENLQRASLNNENSSTIVVEVDKLTQNRFKKCCSIL